MQPNVPTVAVEPVIFNKRSLDSIYAKSNNNYLLETLRDGRPILR